MSSKRIVGERPVSLASMVPACGAHRHLRRCHLRRSPSSSSTFLRSLRSMAVTPLHRYYGRSDSCPPDSETLGLNACSTCGQVSLIHVTQSSGHSVSKHRRASASPGHVTHQRVGPRLHPNSGELGASPLLRRLAAPRRPNRVQVSPSLGRSLTDWPFTSCCSPPRLATTQLQSVTSYVDLERSSTSPTECALRRT